MISKSLSSVKRSKRLSMIIVSVLSSVLYYPIGTLVTLTYAVEMNRSTGVKKAVELLNLRQAAHFYLGQKGFGWLIAAVMAILLAVDGFVYLNHPVAMDFYESLPVKKSGRFRTMYLVGIKIWIIPMLFNLLLAILVASPFHVVSSALLLEILLAKISEICMFLAVYGITILGVMLAGKLFSGILTTVFLFSFELVIKFIFWVFAGNYFSRSYQPDTFYSKLYTSPLYYYLKAAGISPKYYMNDISQALTGDYIKVIAVCCACNIAIALIMAFVSLKLFQRRTRQEAGKTIINKPMQAILKIAIASICGLGIGVIFNVVFNMQDSGLSLLLEMLLMVIATVLAAGFLQVIIASDVRAMFSKMWQTLLAVAIVLVVFACFQWDITGYDRYVPKAQSIRSYALYPQYGGDDSVISYNMEQIDTSELPQEKDDGYYQNNMYLTDSEAITELAQYSIDAEDAGKTEDGCWTMVVYYRLKSGRTVTRLINIPFDVDADLMNRIIGSSEYKNTAFQFVNSEAAQRASVSMIEYVPAGGESIPVKGATIEGLNQAYRKDLETYNFDVVNDHEIYGLVRLDMRFAREGSQDGELSVYYSVYDCYENTIAYLENYGMQANQKLTVDDVSSITISKSLWEEDTETYSADSQTYEDPEEIREILDKAVISDLDTQWSKYNYLLDYDYEILVTGLPETDEEGNVTGREKEYYSYYFMTGEVPEFVEEDLN